MNMHDVVLSCRDVSKTFTVRNFRNGSLQGSLLRLGRKPERRTIQALRNVSLSMKRGEWLGIYGKNGSGKTTLLSILAGIMQPNSGTVERNGRVACFFGTGIGFHPDSDARENVIRHGLLYGMHHADILRSMDDILAFADIPEHIDLPMHCYSRGMSARLAFAAAIHVPGDVLLFDEVLAVGDEIFRKKCYSALENMRAQGKTVVMVNHHLDSLQKHCDRVVFLEKGALRDSAPTALASHQSS